MEGARMKTNRLKEMLAAGQRPVGHMVWEFATRGIARILEGAGVDFVVYDMEHSGYDVSAIADLLAWSAGCDFASFVRLPEPEYHFIARILDAGALGIMIPNVKTPEVAAHIVDCAKYPPFGHRGLGLGHAQSSYRPPNAGEFIQWANENTTVICQIEAPEGVKNAEAIAATPGVDVLWIGHFDLSANMGIVGQFDHPDFQAALATVIAAAHKHGKYAAIQPGSPQQLAAWKPLGFDILSYGADAAFFRAALAEAIQKTRS
jgi:2-dehydro-3-deoxyglucarate aldolase/4-hydroxy-2-oxoheptanedioate aldolase